jgi:hypothetical protein
MGMFDTVHVKAPLLCPNCGAEISSLQTKELSDTMADYKIGSLLTASPVLIGILKERLWCSACHTAGQPSESPVYLVIWHSVLAGVEQDLGKAEARLAAVDRLDLIGWLDEAQREAARWRHHYHALYHDVNRWHEHLARAAAPEPEDASPAAEKRRALRHLFDLPEEILTASDPLAAILAANKHADDEADE